MNEFSDDDTVRIVLLGLTEQRLDFLTPQHYKDRFNAEAVLLGKQVFEVNPLTFREPGEIPVTTDLIRFMYSKQFYSVDDFLDSFKTVLEVALAAAEELPEGGDE